VDKRQARAFETFAAATTAALGTAAGVVTLVPRQAPHSPPAQGPRPAITLTAAQRTLYRLSSFAAAAPQGRGRYVVMREMQDSYKRTSVIDSLTGDTWTYPHEAGGGAGACGRIQRPGRPTVGVR
jgi:hypothetical protein